MDNQSVSGTQDGRETICRLAREFGDARFVLGGGGNVSVKDAGTLWIKASGQSLAELTPERLVPMRRADLDALFEARLPDNATEREAAVKTLMAAAVTDGSGARPSVEAPLHHLMDARLVVHTHPALLNGLTCARDGEEACARILPEALWVPYTDPGYVLSTTVREAIARHRRDRGRAPAWIVLQNHGVFIAGDTPEAVQRDQREIMLRLESAYRECGIPLAFEDGPPPDTREIENVCKALREVMPAGPAAALVVGGEFSLFGGPLTPDHLIGAGAVPCEGTRRLDIQSYHKNHGRFPLVLGGHRMVIGAGTTPAAAQLALALARDAACIERFAQAFGGVRYMDERARAFIDNWEVEHYRRQIMTGTPV